MSAAEQPPIRLAQVGLGPWGEAWTRDILPSAPEVELVASVDKDPSRSGEVASLAEAVHDRGAEAVLVTTDGPSHAAVIAEALDLGCHVLTEKPFVETWAEGAALVRRAEALGLVLAVSQNYRFWATPRQVKAVIDSGAIGEVRRVRLEFRRDMPSLATITAPLPNTALYQLSTHHFDLVRLLLGDIAWVDAHRWPHSSRYAAFSATLGLADGVIVDYSLTVQHPAGPHTPWSGDWTIEGSLGQLAWSACGMEQISSRLEMTTTAPRCDVPPAQQRTKTDRWGTIAEFARLVHAGGTSEISGRSNLGSLAAVQAVRASLDEQRPVPLAEITSTTT